MCVKRMLFRVSVQTTHKNTSKRELPHVCRGQKTGKSVIGRDQITTEDFRVINNCLMIRLPEEVDHYGAGFICENADRYLMEEDVKNVVFDFENTRFMDSSGIGIIMGRHRKISCFGGHVYIIHADRQIRRILKVSGLEKIVEVLES